MSNALARKVLVIGWDAADWRLIQPLLDQGLMPHLQQLVQRGVSGSISTLYPAYSPMLWTSIATGKRAFKHGILGFLEPAADGVSVQPISNAGRRTAALWNIVSEAGGRSLVVGWWPTHRAEPINGVMVSDQFVPSNQPFELADPVLPGAVHPPDAAERLGSLRVHPSDLSLEDLRPFLPGIDALWASTDSAAPACAQLLCEAATIQAVATELLATEPWDLSAVYFNSIDHFCHRFMRYHPPQLSWISDEDFHNYQHVVTMCYRFHDMLLGNLIELAGAEASVILLSDHGFRSDQLRRSEIPMDAAGPAAEHREYGILVAAGPGIRQGGRLTGASLLDVTPTVLTLLGLPVGRDMDGRVLTELFQGFPDVQQIDSWDSLCTARAGLPGTAGDRPPCTTQSQLDSPPHAAGVLQQLIDLGYVDAGIQVSDHPADLARHELEFNCGLSLVGGHRFREAAEQFQRLWLLRPADVRLPIRLAHCLQHLDQLDEMRRVIDHLEEFWGRIEQEATRRVVEMAEYAKQRQESGAGLPEDAAAVLNSAWLTGSEAKIASRLMRGHRVNRSTLQDLRANLAMAEGRNEESLQYLQEVQPNDDVGKRIRHLLQQAWVMLQQSRLPEALAACEECLKLDADSRAALVMAGRVCLKLRQPDRALSNIESAIQRLYEQPEAHLLRAIALARLKRGDDAIAAAKVASSQAPLDPRPLKLISSIYAKRADYSLAGHYQHLCQSLEQQIAATAVQPLQIVLPEVDGAAIEEQLKSDRFGQRFDAVTLLQEPAGRVPSGEPVVVVSGLPRSGTSMMMQMLAAGGLPAFTDGVREADASNPRGYYEHEKTLKLFEDNSWLAEARNATVKIVAPLFPLLPQGENYRVILMKRDLQEVLSSQAKMLSRLGKAVSAGDHDLSSILQTHFDAVLKACERHGIPVAVIDFGDVIRDPLPVADRLSQFLGSGLNTERMVNVVDQTLHRERSDGGK